ncbi:MAG: hypothetical protein RJA76_171 [Bacteroidota bacterium]|jgi:hypothetical protein
MPLKNLAEIKEQLDKEGLVILPGFFDEEAIENLYIAAQKIFQIQFQKLGIEGDFLTQMKTLFENHLDTFINCGKLIQTGLIELYQLAVNPDLINLLKDLGLQVPNMCTRPVLFFNHPDLAKKEHFYKTPLHQDWVSMLSSDDSVVVWLPLMDLDIAHGPVIFYPETHKMGPLTNTIENGFAEVDFDRAAHKRVQVPLKRGDVVIFSTFLVHESGQITNNEIRWSCHFRYTNMEDPTFVNKGFPHPYVYRPDQELIDKYLQN